MTPLAIINGALADDVKLALSPTGTIKATGEGKAVNRWISMIREYKTGIIAVLEAYDERAAIIEFDGQLERKAAEQCAHAIVFCRDCQHHIPQPEIIARSGYAHATPSGCKLGIVAPDSWPPIYSFTGWCCPSHAKPINI